MNMFDISFIQSVIEAMLGCILFYAYKIYTDMSFELTPRRFVSRLIIAGFVGYFWFLKGLPNSFNTIMAGMLAPEMLETIFQQKKSKIKKAFQNALSIGV